MKIDSNDVFTNATAKVVEDAALGLWNKIKVFFKDVSAHDEINMGRAYEEYLKNTTNKNSKIKTLIYRHVPKELYAFYECVGISYNGSTINTESVSNIINVSNKIIITGTGGIGKTTLLKHLFLNTTKDTLYIPVLIELRAANMIEISDISVNEIIYNYLVNNGFRMEKKYFEYSMEEGAYLILFDGYDEVNKEKMQKISNEIISVSGKYPKNKYIVSSRPTDGFVGWNDFIEMESLELTKEQALSMIKKIDFDEKVKSIFYKELDERLYERYQSFASNPLLLTIMLLTFDNRASIPDKLNDFYEQAFATLFNMHDATKEAYVRDIRTGLSCEDFKLIFAYFCFKSYFAGDYEFSEPLLREYILKCKEKFPNINFKISDFQEDLTQSVCMLIKEGINYRFSHRSFQEYFSAWYTCKLVDKDQSDLLVHWIKESDTINTDSYFTMLFNLQSEKVNKIILYPGLKILRKKYSEMGFSLQLLKYLFSGVLINTDVKEDGNNVYGFSLKIKYKYLCNIMQMTCAFNGFTYTEINKEFENGIACKFSKTKWNQTIYFSRLLKSVKEEDLLSALEWFRVQLIFCMDFIEKLESGTERGKKKVKDILDVL